MTMPRSFSLQRRLLSRALGGALVVWLAMAVFVWVEAKHELDELLDAHLAQSAALLVVQQNLESDDDRINNDAPMLHKYASRVAYQVFDNGHLVVHSPNAPHTPMAQHTQGFQTVTGSDGLDWRVFAVSGEVQIYVAEQLAGRRDILFAVLRGFFIPLTLALPLLLLGLWWNVRSGLQPLKRLRQVLLNRSTHSQAHTLDPVSIDETPNEVQPLVDALNELLARLATRIDTERRFTADAAHELRTPIAAIRAQAQVALGAMTDDATRQQALRDTLQGCDRASRVAEQLLTLARLEAPEALEGEVFEITPVLQAVVAELVPEALRRQQTLELSASQQLRIKAQSTLWQILLRNLIHNALRYSPEGAKVSIEASQQSNGQVVVTVQDSGPGLLPDDMARLGERFFRVLGTTASGSGLGWSIVRQIAALQQIEVRVSRSTALGGLQVTLTHAETMAK